MLQQFINAKHASRSLQLMTDDKRNEILNAVYHNAYWGIRGNYRSMPTDCPQRDERMGWTGDRTTGNYGES